MPLLDIAIAQPCFRNNVHKFRSEIIRQNNLFYRSEKRLLYPWKYFSIPTKKANNFDTGRVELWKCRLMIKAVATLEPVKVSQTDDGELKLRVDDVDSTFSGSENQLSSEMLSELNVREKLRRMKISKANKGNTPWNKGRKHSPETLKKIRERTRLAMQDPKVKMKLVNLGHAQSNETRVKIGVGVRIGWEKRRQLMLLQETCVYEWQNLIAEAGKTGFVDEEELQWDSFKILNQQLREEWLESIEERKRNPRPKMSKRAPKSLEQRRRISEAISAKWADPSYRDRVYSGLAKYHGTTIGVAKKPKQKPSEDGQTRKTSPSKKKLDSDNSADTGTKGHNIERLKLKRSGKPLYKDPLVGAKLEMLKNIRAQRLAAESKKKEAFTRAKLLIAEAEKAAKALEVAAKKSPIAHASLIESRKLIAEAVQSIMSIDKGEEESQYNESNFVAMDDKTLTDIEKDVNGAQALEESSDINRRDYNFDISEWQDLLAETENVPAATTFNSYNLVNGMKNGGALVLDDTIKLSSFTKLDGVVDNANHSHINGSKPETTVEEAEVKSPTVTKKWVRGRLVDVNE